MSAFRPIADIQAHVHAEPMTGIWTLLPIALSSALGAPALQEAADQAERAKEIEKACGLADGAIRVVEGHVRFQPSPHEELERVDCALASLKSAGMTDLGFVGNEADPNAILRPPLRFIALGPKAQIDALSAAAAEEKWIITRTATASDGIAMLQFESRPGMKQGEATRLVDRIWEEEFGDIAFGTAPRKLSEPDTFEE